ncbi:MAG: gamma-glutamyl-gamma-aminobutyrate hydrolase family protein, partial [Pseudomonadota bacterium]
DDQRDAGRDAFVLSLIPRALELGLPLLGVCRGIQEVNVALGGTLHQRLHDVAGRMDHRRPREKPWHEHFEARQRVSLRPDGPIAALADADEAMVNSLHGQGIDALGNGLVIEATADDGTIEAVSVPDSDGFALAVQWHAEHEVVNHPLNLALFAAFGAAARAFANQRILAQAKAIQNLPA